MFSKLRYFSEYIDKTRQGNLIIFFTDENTIKDPTPLVKKADRSGPRERKIKEIYYYLFKKKKRKEKRNYIQKSKENNVR